MQGWDPSTYPPVEVWGGEGAEPHLMFDKNRLKLSILVNILVQFYGVCFFFILHVHDRLFVRLQVV